MSDIGLRFAGQGSSTAGVPASQFVLEPQRYEACSTAGSDRCSYPDGVKGAFNASLTYACPTLLTLAHFLGVCSYSLAIQA